jgi:hypothetical protein
MLLIEDDVARLQVSMDGPCLVNRVKGVKYSLDHCRCLRRISVTPALLKILR